MNRPAADLPGAELESELRAAFADATAGLAPTRDPWARTSRAIHRSRTRRRVGAGLAVVAAVLAVAGAVLPLRRDAALPAEHRGPVVTSEDVTTWPTRGDLAGRTDLLEQVRATAQEVDGSVAAVPFLGRVGGLDVALVVALALDDDGQATRKLVTLTGSAAQPVRTWRHASTDLPLPDPSATPVPVPVLDTALTAADGRVRTVVVTLSEGVSAAYSPRPEIDAGGVVSRHFTVVPLENGVGALTWTGTGSAATLRVQRGAEAPVVGPFTLTSAPPSTPTPAPEPALQAVAPSCQGPAFENARLNLVNTAVAGADAAGRPANAVAEVRASWCRTVGVHDVMLVGVRLADGTALQTVFEAVRYGGGWAAPSWPGWPVPAGRELTYPRYLSLTVVEDRPTAEAERTVLFSAPGGATAELVSAAAAGAGATTVIARARLGADGVGVAVTPVPPDHLIAEAGRLYVVVRNSAGRELERVPAQSGRDDPWGTSLVGPVDH